MPGVVSPGRPTRQPALLHSEYVLQLFKVDAWFQRIEVEAWQRIVKYTCSVFLLLILLSLLSIIQIDLSRIVTINAAPKVITELDLCNC